MGEAQRVKKGLQNNSTLSSKQQSFLLQSVRKIIHCGTFQQWKAHSTTTSPSDPIYTKCPI